MKTITTILVLWCSVSFCHAQAKEQAPEKPLLDESITWTTKEENGKVGFGYTDSEWVWAISPKFDKIATGGEFCCKTKVCNRDS